MFIVVCFMCLLLLLRVILEYYPTSIVLRTNSIYNRYGQRTNTAARKGCVAVAAKNRNPADNAILL